MAGRERDRVDELSGGERERVAIAGALAMEPDHLVLDEPFTGLDEPARRSVLARLRDLKDDGTSVIVVTHDLRDVLSLAERVVAMADGRIALDGSPKEVRAALGDLGVRVPDAEKRTEARDDEHAECAEESDDQRAGETRRSGPC
jgi:biotin transport system ATP-binding protein